MAGAELSITENVVLKYGRQKYSKAATKYQKLKHKYLKNKLSLFFLTHLTQQKNRNANSLLQDRE